MDIRRCLTSGMPDDVRDLPFCRLSARWWVQLTIIQHKGSTFWSIIWCIPSAGVRSASAPPQAHPHASGLDDWFMTSSVHASGNEKKETNENEKKSSTTQLLSSWDLKNLCDIQGMYEWGVCPDTNITDPGYVRVGYLSGYQHYISRVCKSGVFVRIQTLKIQGMNEWGICPDTNITDPGYVRVGYLSGYQHYISRVCTSGVFVRIPTLLIQGTSQASPAKRTGISQASADRTGISQAFLANRTEISQASRANRTGTSRTSPADRFQVTTSG
ncbi:hypothetical protein Btru_040010 [Bulinus truncatus]|nr:hypothetical protein Btru_040010 [Bulinus truncatus]